MKPPLLPKDTITTPPGWVLRTYLSLRPPLHFALALLERDGSPTLARQFSHMASKHHLVVRVRAGKYVALDPSVAIRTWALPPYWAQLLALHNALTLHNIGHAFACLPAGALSDYVPERPWLVTMHDGTDHIDKVDRVHYDYKASKTERVEVLGMDFAIPMTSPQETALLLASTGLPREVQAARHILREHPPTKAMARKLNYHGVTTLPDVYETDDPHIRLPAFLEERRQRLGTELLRGGAP